MDAVEDSSLMWFSTKSSKMKGLSYSFAKPSVNEDLTILLPLKYVCLSFEHILIPKLQSLTITSDSLSFQCCKDSDDLNTRSLLYQLAYSDILKIGYSTANCLVNLTIKRSTYENLFSNVTDGNHLFVDTIWLCLDYSDINNYIIQMQKLQDIIGLKTDFHFMKQDFHDSFMGSICKSENKSTFVENWDTIFTSHLAPSSSKISDINTNSDELKNGDSLNNSISVISVQMGKCVLRKTKGKRIKEEFGVSERSSKRLKQDDQKYVYSPSSNHSIEILHSDLNCLKPETYINDNIINFYITYIYYEIMTGPQRQKTHLFNCFFNTKLLGTKTQMKHDTPKSRHDRVAKWTKNVDIFDKDFIIIPVCEQQHWYLVIVCFPWMAGMVDYNELLKTGCISKIPKNNSEFATKTRVARVNSMKETEDIDPRPCILIFNSMTLYKQTDKVNKIREYLTSEWDAKRSAKDGPLIFDKNTVRGYSPKVPQQSNNTDCGVYLLHYVESFYKSPIVNYTKEFFEKYLNQWFEMSEVNRKRVHIRKVIMASTTKSELVPADE